VSLSVSLGDRAVEAPTLDELTDLFGGCADFVKMDIEGSEWEAPSGRL
jgi:hypothetical protein